MFANGVRVKLSLIPCLGLLQHLSIPSQACSLISMDFIKKLPCSEGKDTIIMVIARFSKYTHFVALSHLFNAPKNAKLFFNNVFKLHGIPISFVSDKGKMFTHLFWKESFKLIGIELHLSIAYHSQSNGQIERLNQCIEIYFRCITASKPH